MLTFNAVSLCYNQRVILCDLTFTLRPGELLAVIGPNGAGKSTLIRAASGALAPAAGRITLAGHAVHRMPGARRARGVAVVPQAARLPEAFRVLDTVLMGRTAYLGWLGREDARDHALAAAALARTCTSELATRRIGELSGGEQQRVLIARALAQDAPVLLMDEPTAHLDLKHQAGILSLVRDLVDGRPHSSAQPHAVLIALHDLNLAAQFADRVAVLAHGRLLALGTPAEVLTSAVLSAAYEIEVDVREHPKYKTPLIIPDLGRKQVEDAGRRTPGARA